MKTSILILAYLLSINTIIAQCPRPTIIYPNGGEEITSGSEVEIKFDYGLYEGWEESSAYFYYSIDGGNNWIPEDTISIDTSLLAIDPIITYKWNVPNLNSTNCLIRIKKYEWGCWDESDNIFLISPLTSSSSIRYRIKNEAKIFPNPVISGNIINIELIGNINDIADLQLLNINGQVVKSISDIKPNLEVTTKGLSPGIYILSIRYKNETKIERIIIQ